MTSLLIFTILLPTIFQNSFIICFKINPEAEVDVIVATNLSKLLKKNPESLEIRPSIIQHSSNRFRITYRLGSRVLGINKL